MKGNRLDSRLRGNDGAGGCRLKFRHSRKNGNLELLIFQTTFEHCRYPMTFLINSCNFESLDSRLRGNDEVSGCCFGLLFFMEMTRF
ncbi:Uncharacterised protein [Neisseria meningitidis]|nr:Uncharacterised protein [Neisseria meningitidis]